MDERFQPFSHPDTFNLAQFPDGKILSSGT
jgi:hypothetical protein